MLEPRRAGPVRRGALRVSFVGTEPSTRSAHSQGASDSRPESDMGLPPLFFYGTLMDPDVLGLVVGRPVADCALEPAILRGWRRVGVRGASYPMLVPAPGGKVEGRLWRGASSADLERLDAYEGPAWRLVLVEVELTSGERVAASVYLVIEGALESTDEPWELAHWQARHKPRYLVHGAGLVDADLP